MMEQTHEQQQQVPAGAQPLPFRALVDALIVFGCIPALIIAVIFWAVAIAFSTVSVLATILVVLITLLQVLVGGILLVRYVDICSINVGKYNAAPTGHDAETEILFSVGAGFAVAFFAASIIGILSTAGTLEGWHYTLMAIEVMVVGYQTWRVFQSRRS